MSTVVYINQDSKRLLGKNQDVPYDGAYLFTHKKGMIKSAMIMPPDRPMKWVSKYDSVTISQVGKEMPNGGMNEVGLVVEQTTLWQSSYPKEKELPAIGELQWIQLMLDTCSTVEEVKEIAKSLCIVNPFSRLHYMICDRTGACAIFEFLNEELAIYAASTLPVQVMANTPYIEALKHLNTPQSQWQQKLGDYERDSMERFERAVTFLEKPLADVDFVNDILQSVQRADTAFSIVYDINNLAIYFSSKRFPIQKKISFQDEHVINHAQLAVNIQQSKDICYDVYSTELNRKLVESFFRNPILNTAFGSTISDELITFISTLPDSFELI